MTVCNLWLGLMLSVWMSLWMLVMSLGLGLWSSAAETALADACQFAGGPVPETGPCHVYGVLLECVRFVWFVRLGGMPLMRMRERCVHVSGLFCCTPAGS